MSMPPQDWTGFLKNHHANMQSRNPKRKVSLGEAMKSASGPWKKYKRTFKKNRSDRLQGGSALSPASFSESDAKPATLPSVMGGSALAPASLEKSDAPSPSPAEGGSGCQMRGGRKSRKARKSRKSRK
jgi:hypothetical protein